VLERAATRRGRPDSPTGPEAALAEPARKTSHGASTRGHLWQIDVVRLLTFAAVIAVHSLAFTERPDNQVAAGMMMLLQYGREVFFAITGFVLVYSTWGKPLDARSFWGKRVSFVAVPYVVWSGVYYAYGVFGHARLKPSLGGFLADLLDGGAMYHLYFLVVTIQLYVLFPLLMRFVRATAHRALPVLVAVAVANLGWLAALQYTRAPSGLGGWFYAHAYELLPTYAMYVLGGAYAAVHLDQVEAVAARYGKLILGVAALCVAGSLAVYASQLSSMPPRQANNVLQPAMTLSCLAAVSVVYLVGRRWASGRRRGQHAIEVLSDASFGIYLSHPLVLALLLDYAGFANGHQAMPDVVATVVSYVVTVAGATVITLAARRTPLSLALTGRPLRSQVKRQPTAASERALAVADETPEQPEGVLVPC